MTRVLVTLVAGFTLASAQTGLNLSPQCQNAFASIATNQDAATCLAPGGLIGIAAANTSSSIVDPINTWLGSLCAAPACSNSTLDFLVDTITNGCSTELSLLGYNSDLKATVSSTVKQFYPTVRDVLCLKQGNDICITQELRGIEKSVGTLSIDNVIKLVGGLNSTAIPKDVYCSDCSKAQYNLVNSAIPGVFGGSKADIQNQCGASFVDGQNPTGISQSAVAAPDKNGANMLFAFPDTVATYVFLTIGGLFAMIA